MPAPLLLALPYVAAAVTSYFLAPEVATQVQRLKETESTRQMLDRPEARAAYQQGVYASEEGNNLVEQAAGFVPGVGAIDTYTGRSRQMKFFKGAVAELKKQGYSDQRSNELANALVRDYVARSASEVPSAVVTEGASEVIGRLVLAKTIPRALSRSQLKNFINPLARAGGKSSAVAGAFEGAGSVLSQDVSQRQFLSSGKTVLPYGFDENSTKAKIAAQAERLAGGAAAGAAIAGAFGAVIAGQAVPRPKVSKGARVAGNIVDVAEYPGDKLADYLARRQRFRIPDVPRVRITGEPDFIPPTRIKRAGPASLANLFSIGGAKTDTRTNANLFSNVPSRTSAKTTFPTAARSNFPTDSRSPTNTNKVPPSVPSNNQNINNVPNETETTSNVPSNVPAYASVPSQSIIYRGGLPLLAPLGPPTEGNGFVGGGNRRTYIDELRRGARLYRRLI